MGTNNKSNVSAIAASVEVIRRGLVQAETGVGMIAWAVTESWATPIRWAYGSGDNEVSGLASLSEMFTPISKPDNSGPDGKFLTAMYNAVGDAFGVEWGDNAKEQAKLKMMFRRGWVIGAAKMLGVDVRFENEKRTIRVPLSVAFDLYETEPNDDGSPKLTKLGANIVERVKVNAEMEGKTLSVEQVLARMDKMRVACKGGKHPVFGDVPSVTTLSERLVHHVVAGGLMPVPKPRAPRADKAASFIQSLDFVTECLAMLSGSDESAFAPNDETEAKMRSVAESIAAYFAATA